MPWTGILRGLVILWGLVGTGLLPLRQRERVAGEPPHHLIAAPFGSPAAFRFGHIVRLLRILGQRSFPVMSADN